MNGLELAYFCIFFGFFGRLCETTLLKFSPEGSEFVKQINDSFYISCSNPNATDVWWYKDDAKIGEDFTRVHVERASETSSAQAGLFFSVIRSDDGGTYTCVGKINGEDESASFNLKTYRHISFRDTPAVQNLWEGKEGVVRCEADGDPEPVLSWFVDERHAEHFEGYQSLADGLFIKNVSLEDEKHEFLCRAAAVSDAVSNIASRQIKINVLHAPRIVGAEEVDVYGYLGGTVKLICTVDANPPATFAWLRNDTSLTGEENITVADSINESVATVSSISNAWLERYLCVAENEGGSASAAFNLRKIAKPKPPEKARIHSQTHNSFRLEIHAPKGEEEEEDILGYTVQLLKKEDRAKGKGWEESREIFLPKDEPYVIRDLESHTEYVVRVTSRNKAGSGDYTKEMKTKTLSGSAPSIHAISTSLVISLAFFYFFHLS